MRFVLPILAVACAASPASSGRDASPSVVEASAHAPDASDSMSHADAPAPSRCPPGWTQLSDGNCVPPSFACDADAGAADPRCLPGGLRTEALSAWDCPRGWRTDRESGCAPTLRTDCPLGSGPLPDGTCTDTVRCPDAAFPEVPADTDPARAVYVDGAAAMGGDGSRSRPLRDVAAAIERAGSTGAVLLAAGTYSLVVSLEHRVVIRGVCPSRVTLVAAAGGFRDAAIALRTTAASLDLAGVTFNGRNTHFMWIEGGAAHIHHVVALGVGGGVLTLWGGRLDLDDIAFASGRTDGHTKLAYGTDGQLSMRRASALGSTALYESDGANAVIEDSYAELHGIGLRARGETTLRRVVVGASQTPALTLRTDHVSLHLEDVALTGSLEARNASRVGGRRVSMRDGTVVAIDTGTLVSLQDTRVQWSGDPLPEAANCVSASWGGRISLRRARLGPCGEAGAFAYLLGEVDLEDAWIHDTRTDREGLLGGGAGAVLGGRMALARTLVEDSALAGVVGMNISASILRRLPLSMWLPEHGDALQREPSRVELTDVVVRASRNRPGQVSFGVAAGANTVVSGRRVAVVQQHGAAVLALESGFFRDDLLSSLSRAGPLSEETRRLIAALIPAVLDGPATVRVTDLYVGAMQRAAILFDGDTRRVRPEYLGAWGAYASQGCTLAITNGYFDGRDATESALVSLGDLSLRGGLITGCSRCAALRNAAVEGAVSLTDVQVVGNSRDEICVDNSVPSLRLPMSPN